MLGLSFFSGLQLLYFHHSHLSMNTADTQYTKVNASSIGSNNLQCFRFATMEHVHSAGLGHKLTEVVLGMAFAEETNSTYLYEYSFWSHRGKHGSYEWLPSFLPLQDYEVTPEKMNQLTDGLEEDLTEKLGQWDHIVELSKLGTCNVLFSTKLHMCCDDAESTTTCYCTQSTSRIGSFEQVKGRFRQAFSKSKYTPTMHLSDLIPAINTTRDSDITITWHIRVGDIVLNASKDFFLRISEQLAFTLKKKDVSARVFFFGEGGEDVILQAFSFLPEMCEQFFSGNCFFPMMNVADTLYHMVKSNILITSGSSFAAIAGLLRTKGVTLAAIPKEFVVGIYETSEQILIDEKGNFLNFTEQKFDILSTPN